MYQNQTGQTLAIVCFSPYLCRIVKRYTGPSVFFLLCTGLQSEIDVREQPDSRILASCLAVLLLIGKMHLRQKVIDAVGSFRIPLDDHGMWRTLWKDVLQPSMHELAANGIGCIARAMRDVTISTQDCLLTNTVG